MRILKSLLIGFILLGSAVLAAPQAHAIFSPKISDQIAIIKQHMFAARQLNGTGSPRHGITKVFDDKVVKSLTDADRERREKKEVTGLPAKFFDFRGQSKKDVLMEELSNYGSSFALLFNRMKVGKKWVFITSCLRNDIMELESFRDAVMTEAFRSALLLNRDQATMLWQDYGNIRTMLSLLKSSYETEPELFFGTEPDYYGSACPLGGFWGEYALAIEDLERSWNVFKTMASGKGVRGFGNIWEMAKQNAKIKATQWIAKNQIKLTIAGEGGGSDESLKDLFSSEGMGGIGNRLQQEWNIVKGMFGPIVLIFDPNLYITAAQSVAYGLGIAEAEILDDNACAYFEAGEDRNFWRGCKGKEIEAFEKGECLNCRNKHVMGRTALNVTQDLEKQIEERTAFLDQTETTLQFNLEFNSVAQASTVDFDLKLSAINTEIKRASEAFGDRAGKAIPSICKQMREILLKHCPNKGGDIPACR